MMSLNYLRHSFAHGQYSGVFNLTQQKASKRTSSLTTHTRANFPYLSCCEDLLTLLLGWIASCLAVQTASLSQGCSATLSLAMPELQGRLLTRTLQDACKIPAPQHWRSWGVFWCMRCQSVTLMTQTASAAPELQVCLELACC